MNKNEKFRKDILDILKQNTENFNKFKEEVKQEIKEKPTNATFPEIGLLKKKIILIDWSAKMTRTLSDQETQDFSKSLFDLMRKHGLTILTAKFKKDNSIKI